MWTVIGAALGGIAFSILQLLAVQRVLKLRNVARSALLLLLKMLAWAGAFLALYWLGDVRALLAFGITCGAVYLGYAIYCAVRLRLANRKGE